MDHGIYRHARGGTAHFQSGAALLKFDVNPSVEIVGQVFRMADANTVRIVWSTNTISRPSTIADIISSIGGKARRVVPFNEHWFDFEGPEHTHTALKQLDAIAEIETALVYNVHFRVPSKVADSVRSNLDQVVTVTPEVDQFWREVDSDTSMLRLSGYNRQLLIDVSRYAEVILMAQTIKIEPDSGSYPRHEV